MTNELRCAVITQDDWSIHALVYAETGEIYDLTEDSDADLLPQGIRSVDDCIECGLMVIMR